MGAVAFAVGVDTMIIPAGTTTVLGNGDVDTIDLSSLYAYSWNYTIVANANGTFTVSDVHGGYLVNTVLSGVAYIKFQDKVVSLTPVAPTHTVTFASGVTTMAIPNGTTSVIGNGLVDIADFTGNYGNSSWYKVVANAGGTYSVSDIHGGSVVDAKLSGISELKFTDGTLTLATGVLTPNSGSSTTTATPPVSGSSTSTSSTAATSTASTGPTITFAAGVDTLTVPNGTGVLVGNGDGHDVATFANSHDWYSVTPGASGTITVSDNHGGSVSGLIVRGVADLKFADGWIYNVAQGQYESVLATDAQPNTIIKAPAIAAAAVANAVTTLEIANPTNQALTAHTVTFGQVFVDGDLKSGATLLATVNGQQETAQVDAKTFYADGSIQTAELSLAAPALAAQGNIAITLSTSATATAQAAINPAKFVANGYDTVITLTLHNSDGSTTTQTINAAQTLTKALAAGTATMWLSGPQASEVQVTVPVNGSLEFVLNIRGNADGTFSTDIQAENASIFSTDAKTYTYDVSVTSHGQTGYTAKNIVQAPMQEWHQVVSSTAQGMTTTAADQVVYNVAYLEKTGAVQGYDLSTGVSGTEINSQYINLTTTNTGALGSAQVTTYEPSTGGRPDIGPTTEWAADWLVSQNAGAEAIMLANANAASSQPIHAVDASGALATSATDPSLWLDGRATGSSSGVNNYATIETETGWTLDPAHIGDLDTLAALTQGSEYYIQQVQAQADYDVLSINPAYRSGDDGIVVDNAQVRGLAWTIRDLADAAYLTPATDPLKGYFTGILENNINHILTEYVHGAAGAQEGALYGYILGAGGGTTTPQVAPWQQGYLAIEIAHAAQLGFAGAAEVAAWENNFITGLFLNGANGYNPLEGTAYWLTVGTANTNGINGYTAYTSWSQLYSANYGTTVPTALDGYPDDPTGGYAAILKAALASLWDVTASPNDLAAYAYLTKMTPSLITSSAGYASSETWDITPTLSDGHHLQNSEVYYGTGGTLTAATPNGLLAASSGNNVLNAGSGASILIGGDGVDVLNGGSGNDFLFAGNGTQALYGGAGTNYLRAGTGTDTFVIHAADHAIDTIAGFKLGTDVLQITGGGLLSSVLSLLTTITADVSGNAVLHLGSSTVTLQGVVPGQVLSSWIHLG